MPKYEYIEPEEVKKIARGVWDELEDKQRVCSEVLKISIQRMHQCFKYNPHKPHNGLEPCMNLLRYAGVDVDSVLFARINK
jgi:hypothetical protein